MRTKNQGFGIVVLMCLGIFVCMIDTTIMNIALPAIQNDLHASLETMSWILNVYTMSIAVLSIPLARVADVFGKGRFFIIGSLLFAVGSGLCGLSNSGEFLIVARFVQSVGASILMPISMIIGVSAVSVNKRHIALGILGSTQGLAAALGPAVGGMITQTLGWSWVFYVNVPICFLSIVLASIKLQLRGENHERVRVDLLGVILSSLTIFSITFVLVKGNEWGWTSASAWVCYVGAVIAGFAFLLTESKVKNPMVNLALFRNRQFSAATLAMVAATVYMVGVTVLLPQFLTRFQDKSELQAALLITPVSATIFFIAPISGMLARKIGSFLLILLGFLSLGLSYYLLANLTLNVTTLQVILICILLGAGFGFVIGPASTASAADFEGAMLTASQSVTQMFRQVGVVLAVAISISGLTHYLTIQKQEVIDYATSKAIRLDIPDSVKSKVLEESRKQILSSDMNATNTSKHDTNQVDTNIKSVDGQILHYTADLKQHVKTSMSGSFAKLYQTGFPIVIASTIVSFLFLRKRTENVSDSIMVQEVE